MIKKITKSKRHVAALSALSLVISGLVFAAWTTNGTGTAYGEGGSSSALTTTSVSAFTTGEKLYPGNSGAVKVKIVNPNPYAVTVTAVQGNGAITADSTHATAGCTGTGGVSFTDQTGQSISIPANGSTETTFASAATMASSSPNACQGATFSIPVSLTGASG